MFDFTQVDRYTDAEGKEWEYYGDTSDPVVFYIVPRLEFAIVKEQPMCTLIQYRTGDAREGSGYLYAELVLAMPDTLPQAIRADIRSKHQIEAQIKPLPLKLQSKAWATCSLRDTEHAQITAPMIFSQETQARVAFFIPLDAAGVATCQQALGKGGQGLGFDYRWEVDSRLPNADCTIHFNAMCAFEARINEVGSEAFFETNIGTLGRLPHEFTDALCDASRSVSIEPRGETLPQHVQDRLQSWANERIDDRVKDQVEEIEQGMMQLLTVDIDPGDMTYLSELLSDYGDDLKAFIDETKDFVSSFLQENVEEAGKVLEDLSKEGIDSLYNIVSDLDIDVNMGNVRDIADYSPRQTIIQFMNKPAHSALRADFKTSPLD